MLLLIDAYNLLHQSDALHRSRDQGWLQRARERLLRSLADRLPTDLASETCLVFDAAAPPAGLPSEYIQFQIQVIYAVDHVEADDLLEELIARHPTPKRLTVVSSDHRIQRAASRRSATFFDADVWYAALVERGPRLAIPWPPQPLISSDRALETEKPDADLSPEELTAWLQEFSGDRSKAKLARRTPPVARRVTRPVIPPVVPPPTIVPAAPSPPPAGKKQRQGKRSKDEPPIKPQPDQILDPNLANPFPPGYGEDLLK